MTNEDGEGRDERVYPKNRQKQRKQQLFGLSFPLTRS